VRQRKLPDDWLMFNARRLVGAALLGQERYADAGPLLISGYEGMKQREDMIPAASKVNVKEALKNLVKLYEDEEQPEDAAKWKKPLAEFDAAEAIKKAP
jgi:eukaryotic-like serine/threonine-protein kinase